MKIVKVAPSYGGVHQELTSTGKNMDNEASAALKVT
jgi:hypothetical protein